MTDLHQRREQIWRLAALAIGLILLAASCGSSDPDVAIPTNNSDTSSIAIEGSNADPSDPDDSAATANDASDASDSEPALPDDGAGEQGEEIRDTITSGLGEDEQAALDAGISSLDGETRFGVVAGQMLYEPREIVINGNDVRFFFDEGSVDDSLFDCIVADVLAEDGEVVTFEYPDGEVEC